MMLSTQAIVDIILLRGPKLESGTLDHSAILTAYYVFQDWFERGI